MVPMSAAERTVAANIAKQTTLRFVYFIQQQLGSSLPTWSVPASLFITACAVTYFLGASWGAASLIMPFAIPLAVTVGSDIPLCVAAVITGATFGDVTSPVAGMTNMASNIVHADHSKYISYASPYNFIAAGIAMVLFLITGFFYN
jgi:Na+/H+ antiporter NhaC